ncbi:MAG: hypothetical protein WC352_01855, partial [Candidatus Omnitrophota bacterium]
MRFVRYSIRLDTLDLEWMDELEALSDEVRDRIAPSGDERALEHLFRILEVLKKLYDFTLTKREAEFFISHRDEFSGAYLRETLAPLMARHQFGEDMSGKLGTLDADLKVIEKYYLLALERDEVLLSNALAKMDAEGETLSVIITGGFHTPGIERRLGEQGFSFLTLVPKIEEAVEAGRENALYESAMSGEPQPIEAWMETQIEVQGSALVNDPRQQLAPEPLMTPTARGAAFLTDPALARRYRPARAWQLLAAISTVLYRRDPMVPLDIASALLGALEPRDQELLSQWLEQMMARSEYRELPASADTGQRTMSQVMVMSSGKPGRSIVVRSTEGSPRGEEGAPRDRQEVRVALGGHELSFLAVADDQIPAELRPPKAAGFVSGPARGELRKPESLAPLDAVRQEVAEALARFRAQGSPETWALADDELSAAAAAISALGRKTAADRPLTPQVFRFLLRWGMDKGNGTLVDLASWLRGGRCEILSGLPEAEPKERAQSVIESLREANRLRELARQPGLTVTALQERLKDLARAIEEGVRASLGAEFEYRTAQLEIFRKKLDSRLAQTGLSMEASAIRSRVNRAQAAIERESEGFLDFLSQIEKLLGPRRGVRGEIARMIEGSQERTGLRTRYAQVRNGCYGAVRAQAERWQGEREGMLEAGKEETLRREKNLEMAVKATAALREATAKLEAMLGEVRELNRQGGPVETAQDLTSLHADMRGKAALFFSLRREADGLAESLREMYDGQKALGTAPEDLVKELRIFSGARPRFYELAKSVHAELVMNQAKRRLQELRLSSAKSLERMRVNFRKALAEKNLEAYVKTKVDEMRLRAQIAELFNKINGSLTTEPLYAVLVSDKTSRAEINGFTRKVKTDLLRYASQTASVRSQTLRGLVGVRPAAVAQPVPWPARVKEAVLSAGERLVTWALDRSGMRPRVETVRAEARSEAFDLYKNWWLEGRKLRQAGTAEGAEAYELFCQELVRQKMVVDIFTSDRAGMRQEIERIFGLLDDARREKKKQESQGLLAQVAELLQPTVEAPGPALTTGSQAREASRREGVRRGMRRGALKAGLAGFAGLALFSLLGVLMFRGKPAPAPSLDESEELPIPPGERKPVVTPRPEAKPVVEKPAAKPVAPAAKITAADEAAVVAPVAPGAAKEAAKPGPEPKKGVVPRAGVPEEKGVPYRITSDNTGSVTHGLTPAPRSKLSRSWEKRKQLYTEAPEQQAKKVKDLEKERAGLDAEIKKLRREEAVRKVRGPRSEMRAKAAAVAAKKQRELEEKIREREGADADAAIRLVDLKAPIRQANGNLIELNLIRVFMKQFYLNETEVAKKELGFRTSISSIPAELKTILKKWFPNSSSSLPAGEQISEVLDSASLGKAMAEFEAKPEHDALRDQFYEENPELYDEYDWHERTFARLFERMGIEGDRVQRVAVLLAMIRALPTVRQELTGLDENDRDVKFRKIEDFHRVFMSNLEPADEVGVLDAEWSRLNPNSGPAREAGKKPGTISRGTFLGFVVHVAVADVYNVNLALSTQVAYKQIEEGMIAKLLPVWWMSGASDYYAAYAEKYMTADQKKALAAQPVLYSSIPGARTTDMRTIHPDQAKCEKLLRFFLQNEVKRLIASRQVDPWQDLRFAEMIAGMGDFAAQHSKDYYDRSHPPLNRVGHESIAGWRFFIKPNLTEEAKEIGIHVKKATELLADRLLYVRLPLRPHVFDQPQPFQYSTGTQATTEGGRLVINNALVFGQPEVYELSGTWKWTARAMDIDGQNGYLKMKRDRDDADIMSGRPPGVTAEARLLQAFQYFREALALPAHSNRLAGEETQFTELLKNLDQKPAPDGRIYPVMGQPIVSKRLFRILFFSRPYQRIRPGQEHETEMKQSLSADFFDRYREHFQLDAEFRALYEPVFGKEFFEEYLPVMLNGRTDQHFGVNPKTGEVDLGGDWFSGARSVESQKIGRLHRWVKEMLDKKKGTLPIEHHVKLRRILDMIERTARDYDLTVKTEVATDLRAGKNFLLPDAGKFEDTYVTTQVASVKGGRVASPVDPKSVLAKLYLQLVRYTEDMAWDYAINVQMAWVTRAWEDDIPIAEDDEDPETGRPLRSLKTRLANMAIMLPALERFYGKPGSPRRIDLVDPTFRDQAILTRLEQDLGDRGYSGELMAKILLIAAELKNGQLKLEGTNVSEIMGRYVHDLLVSREERKTPWEKVPEEERKLEVEPDRTASRDVQAVQMRRAPFTSGVLLAEAENIIRSSPVKEVLEDAAEGGKVIRPVPAGEILQDGVVRYSPILRGKSELLELLYNRPAPPEDPKNPELDPHYLTMKLVNLLYDRFDPDMPRIVSDAYDAWPSFVQGRFQSALHGAVDESSLIRDERERKKQYAANYWNEADRLRFLMKLLEKPGDFPMTLRNAATGETVEHPAAVWGKVALYPDSKGFLLAEEVVNDIIAEMWNKEMVGIAPKASEIEVLRRKARRQPLDDDVQRRAYESCLATFATILRQRATNSGLKAKLDEAKVDDVPKLERFFIDYMKGIEQALPQDPELQGAYFQLWLERIKDKFDLRLRREFPRLYEQAGTGIGGILAAGAIVSGKWSRRQFLPRTIGAAVLALTGRSEMRSSLQASITTRDVNPQDFRSEMRSSEPSELSEAKLAGYLKALKSHQRRIRHTARDQLSNQKMRLSGYWIKDEHIDEHKVYRKLADDLPGAIRKLHGSSKAASHRDLLALMGWTLTMLTNIFAEEARRAAVQVQAAAVEEEAQAVPSALHSVRSWIRTTGPKIGEAGARLWARSRPVLKFMMKDVLALVLLVAAGLYGIIFGWVYSREAPPAGPRLISPPAATAGQFPGTPAQGADGVAGSPFDFPIPAPEEVAPVPAEEVAATPSVKPAPVRETPVPRVQETQPTETPAAQPVDERGYFDDLIRLNGSILPPDDGDGAATRREMRAGGVSRREFFRTAGLGGAIAAATMFSNPLSAAGRPGSDPFLRLDQNTGFPFNIVYPGQTSAWATTEPTSIGRTLEYWGHILAGDVANEADDLQRGKAFKRARQLLDSLLKVQGDPKLSWKGLIPWFHLRPKLAPDPYQEGVQKDAEGNVVWGPMPLLDNLMLSASLMCFIGSLLRLQQTFESRGSRVPDSLRDMIQSARMVLENQKPGYDAFYDATPGQERLFGKALVHYGDLQESRFDVPGQYHRNRLFAEDSAAIALLVAGSMISEEKTFVNLEPKFKEYTFEDGAKAPIAMPWDGGFFQMSWTWQLVRSIPQMSAIHRNFFLANLDSSRRLGVPGVYSAAATLEGGIGGYDGNMGNPDFREWDARANTDYITINPLLAYTAMDPTAVRQWAERFGRIAGVQGPYGAYESVKIGAGGAVEGVRKAYFMPNHLTGLIGLIGKQHQSLSAYLSDSGTGPRFVQLYAENLRKWDVSGNKIEVLKRAPAAPRQEMRSEGQMPRRAFLKGVGAGAAAAVIGFGHSVLGGDFTDIENDRVLDAFYVIRAIQGPAGGEKSAIRDRNGKRINAEHPSFKAFRAQLDRPAFKGFVKTWARGIEEEIGASDLSSGRGWRMANLLEADEDPNSPMSGLLTKYFQMMGALPPGPGVTLSGRLREIIRPRDGGSEVQFPRPGTPEAKEWIQLVSRLVVVTRALVERPASAVTSRDNMSLDVIADYFRYITDLHETVKEILRAENGGDPGIAEAAEWYRSLDPSLFEASYGLHEVIQKRQDAEHGNVPRGGPAAHRAQMKKQFPFGYYEGFLFSMARDLGGFGAAEAVQGKPAAVPRRDLRNHLLFYLAYRKLQERGAIETGTTGADFMLRKESDLLEFLENYADDLQQIGRTLPESMIMALAPAYAEYAGAANEQQRARISARLPSWIGGRDARHPGVLERLRQLVEKGKRNKYPEVTATELPAAEMVARIRAYRDQYPNRFRQTVANVIARGIRQNWSFYHILRDYYAEQGGPELAEKLLRLQDAVRETGKPPADFAPFTGPEEKIILEASQMVVVLERVVDRNSRFYGQNLDAEGVSNLTFQILRDREWLADPSEAKAMTIEQLRSGLEDFVNGMMRDDHLRRKGGEESLAFVFDDEYIRGAAAAGKAPMKRPYFALRMRVKQEIEFLPRHALDRMRALFPEIQLGEGVLVSVARAREELTKLLGASEGGLVERMFREEWDGYLKGLVPWHELRPVLGQAYDAQRRLLNHSAPHNHVLDHFLYRMKELLKAMQASGGSQNLFSRLQLGSLIEFGPGGEIRPRKTYGGLPLDSPYALEIAENLKHLQAAMQYGNVPVMKKLEELTIEDVLALVGERSAALERYRKNP